MEQNSVPEAALTAYVVIGRSRLFSLVVYSQRQDPTMLYTVMFTYQVQQQNKQRYTQYIRTVKPAARPIRATWPVEAARPIILGRAY
jgi:hypothetical protein